MSPSNDDAKVDQDVLDILEKETKEFDKVSPIPSYTSEPQADRCLGPGD
jgi:hypothetical protein